LQVSEQQYRLTAKAQVNGVTTFIAASLMNVAASQTLILYLLPNQGITLNSPASLSSASVSTTIAALSSISYLIEPGASPWVQFTDPAGSSLQAYLQNADGSPLVISGQPSQGFYTILPSSLNVGSGFWLTVYNPSTTSVSWTPQFLLGSNSAGPAVVTFKPNGGTGTMASETVNAGAYSTLTPNSFTSPSGDVFAGWATSATGSPLYADATAYLWTASVTLYAVWVANSPPEVVFNANGGTGTMAYKTPNQVYAGMPSSAFTNGNLIFGGWALSPTGPVTYFSSQPNDYPSNTQILYAIWSTPTSVSGTGPVNAPAAYTVTVNGSNSLFVGTPATFTSTYNGTPASYQWSINGTRIFGATSSAYIWTPPLASGSYTLMLAITDANGVTYSGSLTVIVEQGLAVTYNANGATNGSVPVDPNMYPLGARVTVLGNTGNLTYPGYSFVGWSTSPTLQAALISFPISNNTTLYALWSPTLSLLSAIGLTSMAVDSSGNVYGVESGTSVVVKVTPSGVVSNFAGTGTSGYTGDNGPATSATLSSPGGVAVDAQGNVYIADIGNNVVRKVTPGGIITTEAGNGTSGYLGDGGAAMNAELSLATSSGLAVDGSGNLYIADTNNHRIRKVTPAGGITTVAGDGTSGYTGDGAAATSAELNTPKGLAVDNSGNLYISDTGASVVREINASTGYITTVAGNTTQGYSGDGGAATSASLNTPVSLAVGPNGSLYIDDSNNNRVRLVTTTGTITTLAGTGVTGAGSLPGASTQTSLTVPQAVALGPTGLLYIADSGSARILEMVK
jgi:sugar lactone lactonase YvrE